MGNLAYIHARPDTEGAEGIFYVGKGTVRRAKYACLKRNEHYENIVNKYGSVNILTVSIECSDDDMALKLEGGLIKCIKAMGVRLANYTDGGQRGGAEGEKHWTKQKPHLVKRGKDHPNFGRKHSEEWVGKTKAALAGRKAWNKGNHDYRWMHDGSVSKMIPTVEQEKLLISGWNYGRIFKRIG